MPWKDGFFIQRGEEFEQFLLRSLLREHARFGKDAQLAAVAFLHPDVNLGGRVLANADENQAGTNAAGFEGSDPPGGLGVKFFRDRPTVDKIGKTH